MDDFSRLEPSAHMLKWLSDDYAASIRNEIEKALDQQSPGTVLSEFRVVSDPQWLTGAVPSDEDPNHAILVRTAVAFEFSMVVIEPDGQPHDLRGVYSWAGVNLNDPPNVQQRVWFDLNGKLDEFGSKGELQTRVYFA